MPQTPSPFYQQPPTREPTPRSIPEGPSAKKEEKDERSMPTLDELEDWYRRLNDSPDSDTIQDVRDEIYSYLQ